MASVDTPGQILTAEEFAVLEGIEGPCELVDGEIVMAPPPLFRHGRVCARITIAIGHFLIDHPIGVVLSNDSGVVTRRGPDSVRGADVAFYSHSAVGDQEPQPYPDNPPELIFEVKSPSDRWAEIDQKVAEYLAAGVQAVCVIDPEHEKAVTHFASKPPVTYAAADEVTFPDVLSGFSVRLSELLS